jgi:hypothetical protein
MKHDTLIAAALACVAAACASTAQPQQSSEPTVASASTSAPAMGEPVLYARDGSVVQGPGAAAHDPRAREGGRVYLLDLYQKALDEREAFALEVRNLNVTLEQQLASYTRLEQERTALDERVQALAQEQERLRIENADLAARLTTAQIRRLEAEKLLLESRIEEQRARAAATARDDGPVVIAPGLRPASSSKAPAAKAADHPAAKSADHPPGHAP